MEQTNSFTQGRILSPLLRFSIPMFLAVFLHALYGGIDLMVVGQFGDVTGVSAVSTGSQIMMTVTGLITGMTMGVTILLGQKIGEKNEEDSGNVVGASVLFFAIVGFALSVIIALMARPLTALMQAPPEAFEETVQYVTICAAGSIFIVAFNAVSAIFRGMGNSKIPLLFVAIACIANIIGDLIFAGVFHLGATGVAIATVLAQAISVLLSIVVIRRKGFPFAFGKHNIQFHKKAIRSIVKFGSPIALQDLLSNFSFLVIIAIMNSLGVIASAGAGVAEKICIFILLIPFVFTSSLSAFVAQNVGAKEYTRAKKAMYYGMGTSFLVGIVMFVVSFWFGDLLAGIFSNDSAVIAAAADYLKAYAIDCPLVAILFCMIGYLNGHGKTMFTMLQGVACTFLVRIPFAYFMSRLDDVTMFKVGLATPIATMVGIIICVVYLKVSKWNKIKDLSINTELCNAVKSAE